MDGTHEMVEIQKEERADKEARMWIDAAPFSEGVISVLVYVAILFLTICSGVSGHDPINVQQEEHVFKTNATALRFWSEVSPIGPYNRF